MRTEELNEDSNSFLESDNMAPLPKRQNTAKKPEKVGSNIQEKIDSLGYQIIEELSIITALQIHPSKLCDGIETYFYQRKLPSVMDTEFNKKEVKQKADFVLAMTSLFRKALTSHHNKFTILLPSGGIIYFFYEEMMDQPRLFIGTQHPEFAAALHRQDIKFKEMKVNEFERESLLIEGQQTRLFFGFFLNCVINKKWSIEVFANFSFDSSFKETPLIAKHNESRKEYNHLALREETCIGEKISRLFVIRYQTIWFKEDIAKLDERIRQFEIDYERRNRSQKISHDYEFKICKYSLGLDQEALDKVSKPASKSQ